MPTYQYRCKDCGTDLEVVQKFTDSALTECPNCENGELRKIYNAVGVVFKGSGFYRTDSRDAKSGGSSGADGSNGSNGSETKNGGASEGGSSSEGARKSESTSAKSDSGSTSGSSTGSGTASSKAAAAN
ncbi:FmdB family transcriptional regulator [Naumannella sp. ID2617S]|nr:FmdB family transcriptional regulator [Naumannella sp. ID2617S]